MSDLYSESNKEGGLSEEDDLFYFESDHLALQGNTDYSELLKTIVILEAQRVQGIKNYETVLRIQKEALEEPLSIVGKLQRGEDLGVPKFQNVPDIPKINFNNYNVPIPKKCLELIDKTLVEDETRKETKLSKGSTHNQAWSPEEQKRLEELLITYPPEAVEMNRFKKIAKALGNRTVRQVTSRVQKYFLKLYKCGLPIPGRIPKWRFTSNKSNRSQKYCRYYGKPSSFFPDNIVPVNMSEDDAPGPSKYDFPERGAQQSNTGGSFAAPNIELSDEMKTRLKIKLLEEVKKVKDEESSNSQLLQYRHLGFMCDYCNEDPIVGSRWHCDTCRHDTVDFCTDCLVSQLFSSDAQNHLSHRLLVIGVDTERECGHSAELNAKLLLKETNATTNAADYGSAIDEGTDTNDVSGVDMESEDEDEDEDGNDTSFRIDEQDLFGFSNQGTEDGLGGGGGDKSTNMYDEDYFLDSLQGNYLDPNYQLND